MFQTAIQFNDIDPSLGKIDSIADGNLARLRRQAMANAKGGLKASASDRKASYKGKFLVAQAGMHS